ncbi:tumor necrosis factor receptor superfamily member 8 [Loxodonta africana]|uniref:tumor necrosis factor receptor superfamily member 8 n=1 Tax=Loxodonta africana TaxID=9785 RepID=UPI0030D54CBF
MHAFRAVLGLLLLRALRAPPTDRGPEDICAGDPNRYYDKDAGKCCYRCPSGDFPEKQCVQSSTDCGKQCGSDHYLNEAGRCTACVTCSGDDLVEKTPCTRNSSRVCECRPGKFCATSAANSCARCLLHTICPPGMIVKLQGTAERNTVCEPAPTGARPGCSTSPENCKTSASTTLEAMSSLTSPATSSARTMPHGGGPVHATEDASKLTRPPHAPSSAGKPSPDPGLSPQHPCPQGSADCRKQCGPDYYLDEAGRCTACVSCSRDDLVEKTPCTWNSSRVCECRPGMVCATSATNSCARCITRSICPSGMAARLQGTASRDTTSELPPSGTHPDCLTSPEDREMPSSSTIPTLMSPLDSETSKRHGGSTTYAREDTSTPTSAPVAVSSMEKPVLVTGPVVFWVTMVLLVILFSGIFLLCHWKACRRGIQQKLHLCFPGQNFRTKPEPGDSRPGRKPTEPCRIVSVVEPGPEEQGLMSVPAVETCPSVGTACLESLRLLEASPVEGPSSPRGPPEPRATTEHTNNKIEKIYIMKADTVIVGTVKTEVPESRGLAVSVGPEFEEELEVDHAPHYPEQETERPLGSCEDVMFSVEEEGKEESLTTTISEKQEMPT